MKFGIENIHFCEDGRLEYVQPSGKVNAFNGGYQLCDFRKGQRIRVYIQNGGGNSLHTGAIEMREGVVIDTNFRKQRRIIHPPNIALQLMVDRAGANTSETPEPVEVKPRRIGFFYDRIDAAYRVNSI